jgi:tellurite resistance protein TehA-like permease
MEGGIQNIMVDYPELSNISINGTIADFMTFPNNVYPFFWAWIIGGLWFIISMTLYFKEQEKIGKGKMLSSMSVSALACMLLSLFGTLFGIITLNIMIYVFVVGLSITLIWFFSKGN